MNPSNPFVVKKPVESPELLIGRSSIFPWLQKTLGLGRQKQALAISGQPGIGKTSILRNLSLLPSRHEYVILQIDAREWRELSSSDATWKLVKTMSDALTAKFISYPPVEKPSFVLQPERVFFKDYWDPIILSGEVNKVLLVFDNMGLLASEMNIGQELQRKRDFLWSLLKKYKNVEILITLQGRPELYSPKSIYPFSIGANYQLQYLTRDETSSLLKMTDQYTIADYVCDYIFRLTSGHPADVQRMAYQIFERSVESGYRFITSADVLAILSSNLKAGDFYQPVYGQRENIMLHYSPEAKTFEFVDDVQET